MKLVAAFGACSAPLTLCPGDLRDHRWRRLAVVVSLATGYLRQAMSSDLGLMVVQWRATGLRSRYGTDAR